MCIISNEIKFCTCLDEGIDIEDLDFYWKLYKLDIKKDVFIVGLMNPPTSFYDSNFELNQETILNRLNNPNAFDFKFDLIKGHRIEVVVKFEKFEHYTYCYEFSGRKWYSVEEDPFILESKYEIDQKGKLNGFY